MLFDKRLKSLLLQFIGLLFFAVLVQCLSDVFDHESKEGRLGSVEVILPKSIGNESIIFNDDHEVSNHSFSSIKHVWGNKALDNPVRVPVVPLFEPAAWNY